MTSPNKSLQGTVQVIIGGPVAGGASHSRRKKYTRSANLTELPTEKPWCGQAIAFNDADLSGVTFPHNDAGVKMERIEGFEVRRLLVDDESSCDIL